MAGSTEGELVDTEGRVIKRFISKCGKTVEGLEFKACGHEYSDAMKMNDLLRAAGVRV